jgi:MFS-type transporter involved in bile tolerance (Atg22 family)
MGLAYGALTTIQVDYGFDQRQIASISVANTLFAALGCVVGGQLADRFGLRRMLATFYLLSMLPGLLLAGAIAQVGLAAVPADLVWGTLVAHGFLFGQQPLPALAIARD